MKKIGILISILLAMSLMAGCGLFGPKIGTIAGVVLDKYELTPIQGALVQIGDLTATTDNDGKFSIVDVTQGSGSIKVTKEDYKVTNQTIIIEETTSVTLYLEKDIDPAHNIVSNFTNSTYRLQNIYTDEDSLIKQNFEQQMLPWFTTISGDLADLEVGLFHSMILGYEPGTYDYVETDYGWPEYVLIENPTSLIWEWQVNDQIHGITVKISVPDLEAAITEDNEGNLLVNLTGANFSYIITSDNNTNALYEATLKIGSENVKTLTLTEKDYNGTIRTAYVKIPAGPTAELNASLDTNVNLPGSLLTAQGTLDFATATDLLKFTLDGSITTPVASFTGDLTLELTSGLTIDLEEMCPIAINGNGTFKTASFEVGGGFAVHIETMDGGPVLTSASFNASYKSASTEFTGKLTFEFENYVAYFTSIVGVDPEWIFGVEGNLTHNDGSEYDLDLHVTTNGENTATIDFNMVQNNFTLGGAISVSPGAESSTIVIDLTDDSGTRFYVTFGDGTQEGDELGNITGADGTKYATIFAYTYPYGDPALMIEYTDGSQFSLIPLIPFIY